MRYAPVGTCPGWTPEQPSKCATRWSARRRMRKAVRHRALTGPGHRGQFRLRMGDYRAIYEIDRANRRITVLRVQHRSDAYGD